VLLDRAHTDYDNVFHDMDAEKLDTSLPPSSPPPAASSRSPASDKFASTSETNTSDRSSSSLSSPSSTDLSQILLNISSCRWRHFRPRTLPLHELDNAHPLFRKLSRSLKRPASSPTAAGQPFGSLRPGRVIHAPPPTAGKWTGCRMYRLGTDFEMLVLSLCLILARVLFSLLNLQGVWCITHSDLKVTYYAKSTFSCIFYITMCPLCVKRLSRSIYIKTCLKMS